MSYSTTIRSFLVALAAIGVLGLTACDQTIDKNPEQCLPIDQVFQDVQGAQSALTGAYSGMPAAGVHYGSLVLAGALPAYLARYRAYLTTCQQSAAINMS